MSETKEEKQLAGSTTTAQDSKTSSKSMKDGEEPDDMLLALLWSPLATLIKREKALLATANYNGKLATVIILVGTQPTDKGISCVEEDNPD